MDDDKLFCFIITDIKRISFMDDNKLFCFMDDDKPAFLTFLKKVVMKYVINHLSWVAVRHNIHFCTIGRVVTWNISYDVGYMIHRVWSHALLTFIWRHRNGSTLAPVVAWCLTASSHYLSQCWIIIKEVMWHSSDDNYTGNAHDISHWYEFWIIN